MYIKIFLINFKIFFPDKKQKTCDILYITTLILNIITILKAYLKQYIFLSTKMSRELNFRYQELGLVNSNLLSNKASITKIDLGHNRLTYLPAHIFSDTVNLKILILDHNMFRKLRKVLYPLTNLEMIDLSYNFLRRISKNMFVNNTKLSEILLESNLIMNLKSKSFKNLINLKKLDLQLNHIENVNIPLQHLKPLQSLDLSRNNVYTISQLFYNDNPSLQELQLNFNPVCCLHSQSFEKLHKLEILSLNHCELRRVPSDLFKMNVCLKELHLCSSNIILTVDLFNSLSNLELLHLACNQIENHEIQLAFDKLTRLKQLLLQHNHIDKLDNLFLYYNTNLAYLNLNNNPIDNIIANFFYSLTNLIYLNIEHISINCCLDLDLLKFNVHLEELCFSYVHSMTGALPLSLERLKYTGTKRFKNEFPICVHTFQNNHLYSLTINGISDGKLYIDFFTDLQHLTYLNLKGNDLMELHAMIFSVLTNLNELILDDNSFDSLEVPIFSNDNNIVKLSLKNCHISSIFSVFFENLTKLEYLNLGNNFCVELDEDVFRNLIELRHLYLNDGVLNDLPFGIFEQNSNLVEIHLEQNPLKCFRSKWIEHLSSLKEVYIDKNTAHNCNLECLKLV